MKNGEAFVPYRQFIGAIIPNWLLMSEMSCGAKLCYGRLAQYAGVDGRAYPGYVALGTELGMSRRQVMRYVRELVDEKLLRVEVKHDDAGKQLSNSFVFLWPSTKFVTPGGVSDMSPKENQYNNNNIVLEKTKSGTPKFNVPSLHDLVTYATENSLPVSHCEPMRDYYEANGWKVGKNPMKEWRAAFRNWCRRGFSPTATKEDSVEPGKRLTPEQQERIRARNSGRQPGVVLQGSGQEVRIQPQDGRTGNKDSRVGGAV